MSERVTYKRLLRQFAAIGPICVKTCARRAVTALTACPSVSAPSLPRTSGSSGAGGWCWSRRITASATTIRRVLQRGREWIDKALPKKHQAEVERTCNISTSSSAAS